jgi:hypothetical protein
MARVRRSEKNVFIGFGFAGKGDSLKKCDRKYRSSSPNGPTFMNKNMRLAGRGWQAKSLGISLGSLHFPFWVHQRRGPNVTCYGYTLPRLPSLPPSGPVVRSPVVSSVAVAVAL